MWKNGITKASYHDNEGRTASMDTSIPYNKDTKNKVPNKKLYKAIAL